MRRLPCSTVDRRQEIRDGSEGVVEAAAEGSAAAADHSSPCDPADVDLGQVNVVVALVQRGVAVATNQFRESWGPRLVETAASRGLFSAEASSIVGFVNDATDIERLIRKMVSIQDISLQF